MSHFTKVKTSFKNKSYLIKALEDMGFKDKLQVHDTAEHLYGYQGDRRPQTAEIIIPRKFVGGASNDIGFKLQEDGSYEAIISEYDTHRYGAAWVDKLTKRYALETVKQTAKKNGFVVLEEKEEKSGEINLVLERY